MHRASSLSAADEASAAAALLDAAATDGLPVIIPTPERVAEMLMYAGALDPDVVIANVGPSMGEATIEKIAANAVMAGCPPETFPVVLAGVEAICDPSFELGLIQTCTHPIAPMMLVNGPARVALGIASGTGALGPGSVANVTIGRALRLVMWNIGGGVVGVGDMAQLGGPAKLSYCLGEAEEESPWEPMHVERGFQRAQSVVTVLAAEAPHSVMAIVDPADVGGSARRLAATVGGALANVGSNNIYFGAEVVAMLLNPDHPRALAAAGLSRADARTEIHRWAVERRQRLRDLAPTLVGAGPADDLLHVTPTPEGILLAVAGGDGVYSAVVPTWGAGAEGSQAVSRTVPGDDVCEVPL